MRVPTDGLPGHGLRCHLGIDVIPMPRGKRNQTGGRTWVGTSFSHWPSEVRLRVGRSVPLNLAPSRQQCCHRGVPGSTNLLLGVGHGDGSPGLSVPRHSSSGSEPSIHSPTRQTEPVERLAATRRYRWSSLGNRSSGSACCRDCRERLSSKPVGALLAFELVLLVSFAFFKAFASRRPFGFADIDGECFAAMRSVGRAAEPWPCRRP